jgi:hypothetical protein
MGSSSRSQGQKRRAGGSGAPLLTLFGPLLAGLVIDAIDLVTYGPIGIYTGLLAGGLIGYVLAPVLGFPERGRWVSALVTGIYCMMPMTAFLPLATVAAGLSRALLRDEAPREENGDPALRPEGSIEAEYEVEPDGSKRR